VVVGLAAVAAVATACGSSGSSAAKPKRTKQTTTPPAAPPVAPLTGLADPGGDARNRPLLSIKIDNDSSLARPQTGIEAADVVWDEVVEGQATRFLAMFNSQAPEVVGPVRSVRLTDPLIVWPEGGIFTFSGGAPYAINGISQAPVKLVDESKAGSAMFRDSARRPPHNLYARPPALFAMGGDPTPPPPLFQYSKGPATAGTPATAVHIGFSREFAPTYTWDAASGTWLRSTPAGPFVTKSGKQIAPQNVIVMPVTYAGGVGVIGAEAQLVGNGTVQVLTNGRVVQGTWQRAAKADHITFSDTSGKPIRLTPGQTWVELPDVSYSIDVQTPSPTAP
ncbi:MAG: DUF3048 domain-containing protein, partial [Acidimicrobiia bacterium]